MERLEPRRVLAGNVAGAIFEDLDADAALDAGEGLSGWTVYADLNNNATRDGTEPQSTSSSSGSYSLGGLTAGPVVVRAIAPVGWALVDTSRTVTVVDNATQTNQNLRGALAGGAVLTGSIWHDANGNGIRDTGETMNASAAVYVDLDNDSVLDPGEPMAYASSNNGGATLGYRLTVAQAGTYTVRQQLSSPWQQASPSGNAGQTVTVTAGQRLELADFIDRNPFVGISGTVFEDTNGNAARESTETIALAGWQVYADLNDNGSPDAAEPTTTSNGSGSYSLTVDTQGTLTSVAVRTVVPAGWVATGGGNRRLVSSLKGGGFYSAVFGNQTTGGLVSGAVWNDTNADGVRASSEGVVSGRTIYADLDNDSTLDAGEPQAVTFSDGTYQLLITTAGTVNIRQVVPAGWEQTAPAASAAQSVTVTLGSTGAPATLGSRITGRNFGVRSNSFTVSGTVFDDADANGFRGTGEALLEGWRIFADLNDNGSFDVTEPASATSSSGTYSLMLTNLTGSSTVKFRVDVPTGWQATSPSTGMSQLTVSPGGWPATLNYGVRLLPRGIAGTVWNDADGDGTRSASEPGLSSWTVYIDANNNGLRESTETMTFTATDGSYVLPVSAAGDYVVRLMPSTSWLATAPTGGVRTVAVGTTRVNGTDFGYRNAVGSVAGTVYDDVNANGTTDPGEAGLSGWRVFVDLNNNGLLDGSEPSTTTSSSGSYSLSVTTTTGSLAIKLRTQAVAGWSATAPTNGVLDVTVNGGQSLTGRNFGNVPAGAVVSGFAWNDTDGNGLLGTGESGYGGWTIFADANNNSVLDTGEPRTTTLFGGTYQLVLPTAGAYTIRPVADSSWATTAPVGGGFAVTVTATDRLAGRDFGRQYVIGSVAGTVFNDADGSGGMNGAETGLSGWRVFADLNGNGLADANEPSTTTSSNGSYSLLVTLSSPSLAVMVRTQVQQDWLATSPTGGSQSVTLTRGQTVSGRTFGVRVDPSIAVVRGVVFDDANANGVRDAIEAPLAGRTVYVDADGDGTLDADEISTTTGSDGTYRIAVGAAGTYTLRQVVPTGFAQVLPAGNAGITATVALGDRLDGRNFGTRTSLGGIAGTVFNDMNANGTQDVGEPGLTGWRVYVDLDADSVWDSNEPTNFTSINGSYAIGGVPASSAAAVVRTVTPTGWTATLPTGGQQSVTVVPGTTVSGRNFGTRFTIGTVSGMVFSDLNGNGTADAGEAAGDVRVYADLDGDDAYDADEPSQVTSSFSGTYSLQVSSIDPANAAAVSRTVGVRIATPAGWVPATPSSGERSVTITGGQSATAQNFIIGPAGAVVTGLVWNDADGNGTKATSEPGLAMTIYVDANNNGIMESTELRTSSAFDGSYRLLLPAVGSYVIRPLASASSWVATTPAPSAHSLTVAGGESFTARNFGLRAATATVAGTVYEDADQSGSRGAGETGLAGWQVYADLDEDGVPDVGEPTTTTSSTGGFSLQISTAAAPSRTVKLRTVAQTGWTATAPIDGVFDAVTVTGGQQTTGRDFGIRLSSGLVTGTVWNDLNNDGIRGTGEAGAGGRTVYVDANDNGVLDAAELRTTTLFDGSYKLMLATAGTAKIRTVLPTGWQATLPAGAAQSVAVTLGNRFNAIDFGNRYTIGSVGGAVFNDLNGNGIVDTGEGVTDVRVYADLDGDDAYDANEPSMVTSSSGTYSLQVSSIDPTDPAALNRIVGVRIAAPAGWVPATPSSGERSVTITGGQSATARNFAVSLGGAVVTGLVWNDADGNGTKATAESGLAMTVYVDANDNGTMDSTELRTSSASDGSYRLLLPAAGSYVIRPLASASSWVATTPAPSAHSLTVAGGESFTARNFGLRAATGIVSGSVYEDTDQSGSRGAGEAGLAGWQVYADLDEDGVLDVGEPTATSSSNGGFSLQVSTVAAPTRTVKLRTVAQTGWTATAPVDGVFDAVTVKGGHQLIGNDFGIRLTSGLVTGTVWNDLNNDGIRGTGEAGAGGRTVYVDANDNGVLDAAELRTTTLFDGSYKLMLATAGTAKIRTVLPTGWQATLPAGAAQTVAVTLGSRFNAIDFGNRYTIGSVGGAVFNDLNGNGTADAGEGVTDVRVYADLDGDDAYDANEPSMVTSSSGTYSLQVSSIDPTDPAALNRTVGVRIAAPAGWVPATPSSGERSVTITGGQSATAQNFVVSLGGAVVTGLVWNDADGNGTKATSEPGLAMTVYVDANNNGIMESTELRTSSAFDGSYRLLLPAAGSYVIRPLASASSWVATTPAPSEHSLTVAGGESFTARNFGLRAATATVAGTVYEDADQSGSRGPGEAGLAGWQVYADLDEDGVPDVGEPTATSLSNGGFSLQISTAAAPTRTVKLRTVAQTGWTATAPVDGVFDAVTVTGGQQTTGRDFGIRLSSGLVTGTVWNDLNNDGIRGTGEAGAGGRTVYVDANDNGVLDAAELRTTTLFDGSYKLMLATAGTAKIRTVLPTGWQATLPAGAAQSVAVTLGNRFNGTDFGTRNTIGSISGAVFNDVNGNGTADVGEAGMGGWTVFVDANDNGILDTSETRTLTSTAGTFTLSNLAEGTARLRLVRQTGWTYTTPVDGHLPTEVAGGQTVTGRQFGVRLTPPTA